MGRVFLTGRSRDGLDQVAGSAEVAVVDALDEAAVDDHARFVVEQVTATFVNVTGMFPS